MKKNWKLQTLFLLSVMLICFTRRQVQAMQMENLLLSEILEDNDYVEVELGGGYLGKNILYDIDGERTIVKPNIGEHKTIIRDEERATVFYGKYRGKDEHEEYKNIFPELDIQFFYKPIKELKLTMEYIGDHDYQIEVTEQDKIENFLIALSYVGIIDNEVFSISTVDILFDERYRPSEVRFHVTSDVAESERVTHLEEQLNQKFEYITKEKFDKAFLEMITNIAGIKPFEEVEVIDYIDELSNVVKLKDEHFLVVLQAQTKELSKRAGWDKKAIFAYLEAVDNKFGQFNRGYEGEQITQEEYLELLDRVYKSAHLVGSNVYTYMFESSKMKAKDKALLVIEQMGGYLDSNGMLQLKNGDSFYLNMEPHSEFLEAYATCVRKAYQKKNKTYRQLDNVMIHQFRMYIDKHNIEYVRNNFDGKTDYEKLKNYAKEFEFSLYYGESSRHHNKIQKNEMFKEQRYDKILTPNRLSEFIINVKTGEFITEWDALKVRGGERVQSDSSFYKNVKDSTGEKIVDTESFNYAPADYVDAHQQLDVLPASPVQDKDLYLENNLKKKMKKIWESPVKIVYREKYRKPKDYLK